MDIKGNKKMPYAGATAIRATVAPNLIIAAILYGKGEIGLQ